ncbi:MAG: proton-conducting membrane transporter [Halobacteriales archaeon]
MTTRPRLRLGAHLLPGVVAVALFVVLAYVSLRADLGEVVGFPEGESITRNIGFALFDIPTSIPSEGFLAAFLLIALVLDAALDGAVLLARREEGGRMVTALRAGGEEE